MVYSYFMIICQQLYIFRKAAGLNEIPSEVEMTKKIDNILQLCNAEYKQITKEKWIRGCILPFSKVLRFIMPCTSIVSHLKSGKILEKIRMAFKEVNSLLHYRPSKNYMPKISYL